MIKAIFFDIDGTLVNSAQPRLTPTVLSALQTARNQGIYLFIATGRHKSELKNLEDFCFDAYITLNGQYCFNENGIIYENSMDKEDIAAIVSQLSGNPYPCVFAESDRMYVNMINEDIKMALTSIHVPMPPVEDVSQALNHKIYQLIPYVRKKQEHLPLSVVTNCNYTRWNTCSINITPKNGSKRAGIDAVLKHYRIPLEDTMAFGDGPNDIDMLQHAAVGIAMGNAAEEVKKAADYVTAAICCDGVFQALAHFGIV